MKNKTQKETTQSALDAFVKGLDKIKITEMVKVKPNPNEEIELQQIQGEGNE